jgi:hypothetical protein
MYTLPDDVVRAAAAFVPLSGLLMLARCSQRVEKVLRGQLTSRLDDLFVVVLPSDRDNFSWLHYPFIAYFPWLHYPWPQQSEVEAMFGMSTKYDHGVYMHVFVEASKGYDGPPSVRVLGKNNHNAYCLGRRIVKGMHMTFPYRFDGWLDRKLERQRTMATQGEATSVSTS